MSRAGSRAGRGLVKNPRMSTNPYAPPLARVDDARGSDVVVDAPFFAVAPWKVLLMCVVTMGLYQVYWFYANWRLVQRRERSEIWPVPRAIFGLFFCNALFQRMRRFGKERGVAGAESFSAGALATTWIIGSLAWRLPAPFTLVGLAAWIALLPVQSYASRVNAHVAPEADRNARLTWLNWIAVVLGGAFFVLVVIGLTVPGADR